MVTKDEHDKEMLIDELEQRKPTPEDLTDNAVFRSELLRILGAIAERLLNIQEILDRPIQVRTSY